MSRSRSAKSKRGSARLQPAKGKISLSRARQDLCPLVRKVGSLPEEKVGIMVRGNVRAYLVSAKHLENLEAKVRTYEGKGGPRRRLKGTLKIVGDLEEGSRKAVREMERVALRSWGKRPDE